MSAGPELELRIARAAMLYDASRMDQPGFDAFERGYWRGRGALEEVAGGRGTVAFIHEPGRRWVLRHYRRGGLVARFLDDSYLYTGAARARAFAEFRLLRRLREWNLPVPAPVAARVVRAGLVYRADLITEELPARLTLAQALESGPVEPETWRAVGRCVASLHARGVQHADLNAHNLLLGAGGEIYVLDFDRGRIRERGAWEGRVLERLRRSLAKVTRELPVGRFSEADWRLLLEGNRGHSPISLRILYLLLSHLVAPIIIAIEGWRELRDRAQRGRVKQRLGFVAPQPGPGCLWIHAVSVGEVQAAAALVRELKRQVPGTEIVLTTVTATGAARARTIFGGEVRHCYLPYDLPGPVGRFLDRIRPRAVVVLETEIWPTLYRAIGRRGLPLVIASARISDRSVNRYRRVASLVRDALSGDVSIGAQSEVDAARLEALGAPADRVRVTGNVKFDLEIPESVIAAGRELRSRCAARRPVWIAGSTHEGEEAAALAAHAVIRSRHPSALLVLVPRHPQRFDAVRSLLSRGGHSYAERSAGALPAEGDDVLLVDTIGELQMFYAFADAAFVGGSLVPVGGHSLLEPALLGMPVISGPWTQNAPEVAELLTRAGALATVHSADELARKVLECLDDPTRARADGEKGRAAVAANRGAVQRVVEMVLPTLRASASEAAAAPESSGSR